MTALAIEGIGVVGGFGCGLDALRQALDSGFSPIGALKTGPGEEEGSRPAFLAESSQLEAFLPKRAFRRIDHFARLALLGSHLALQDAGRLEEKRQRLGVVIATGYGAARTTFSFLDSVLDDGDTCASPTNFSNSVHNAAAAHVSILLGATGPSLTVSQFEMSVFSALLTARQWLLEKRVDAVLFGGVDECGPVLGYCHERFFGEGGRAMTPLLFDRQSAVVGEGAAFFLLTRGGEGAGRYGFLSDLGFGRLSAGGPRVPENALLLLGADGHSRCGAGYGALVPPGAEVAAYAPLYGSLPVGSAFDLAVAGLTMREGRVFAQPGPAPENVLWRAASGGALGDRPVCGLKIDGEGVFGSFTVQHGQS
jgi:3-oxoacyl-[acyl-carrier-protein] synthase II